MNKDIEIGNILPNGQKPTKVITDKNDTIFKVYKKNNKNLVAVIFTEKGVWILNKDN